MERSGMNTTTTIKKGGAKKTKRSIAKSVTARLARATRRRAQLSAAAAPLQKTERSDFIIGV